MYCELTLNLDQLLYYLWSMHKTTQTRLRLPAFVHRVTQKHASPQVYVMREQSRPCFIVTYTRYVQWNVFYRLRHSSMVPMEQMRVTCLTQWPFDQFFTLSARVFKPATFRLLAQRFWPNARPCHAGESHESWRACYPPITGRWGLTSSTRALKHLGTTH